LAKEPKQRSHIEVKDLASYIRHNINLFQELEENDLIGICQQMGLCYLSASKKAFEYGEPGDFFYIILDG
jgi:hypothetical protein